MIDFDDIWDATAEALGLVKAAEPESDDIPADVDTILATTEKLLAVSKGHAEPDERDSLVFRRILTPDKLFAERIDLDAGRLRQNLMRILSRRKTVKAMPVSYFDPYTEGLIVGHPLSSPLEEINPLQLVEQGRRISQFGPGGLASSEQITPESQTIHPSSFGFLAAIEGPESEKIGLDTRMAWGTKLGSDGQIYQQFNNRRSGKPQWVSPSDLADKVVGLPD